MPSNDAIRADVNEMLGLYQTLIRRGGTLTTVADGGRDPDEDADVKGFEEGARRLRIHSTMERLRNKKLVDAVKKHHGHQCQCCGVRLSRVYGTPGDAYIEAHHLVPLHLIEGDGPLPMNPEKDFAVLCANCHRMVHRAGCPSLEDFRALLNGDFLTAVRHLKS